MPFNGSIISSFYPSMVVTSNTTEDSYGVWNDLDDPEAFIRFCDDVDNFPPGILRWEVEKRSKEIDFLDLTISINEKNHIMTKTYRKPQNIYQYIPQRSAHPPGVGRAIIFGCTRRYRLQNSLREDYLEQINLLYTHMKAREWEHHLLAEWIMKSAEKLEHDLSLPPRAGTDEGTESDTPSNSRTFIHLQYIIPTDSTVLKSVMHLMKHVTISEALMPKLIDQVTVACFLQTKKHT